ncbi:MAG: 2-hydroxyacyl-CoA dehydratase [Deltaproteobacteria bacterium]|nr:2-hydroxyacyl-CoA dehydratase [Deltaproteobacteria bacterium]
MPEETALEIMKRNYRDRYRAAKEWKAAGGKVVGYVYTSVPEELILAAGCLPVMITGDPEIGTEAGDRYMEDYFCPFVRSVHNLFVVGAYDWLDLAIFPHGNDSIKRCYFYLWTEKLNDPALRLPPLAMFDLLHTRKHIANRYVRGRVAALKEKLEEVSGNEITEESLRYAIEVMNEKRRLLKQVAELRRADPPRLSGLEALQVIGSSFFMPKEEHNDLLRRFLAEAVERPPREGVRLYVSGTILDNTQLYELLESCGAVIVAEDVCTGNRYSENLVDPALEPLDALTDRYHSKSLEGRMYPLSVLVDYVAKSAQEAKVQGAVFNYLRWDDSHGWNYPSQRDALKELGIPSLAIEMQEYKLAGAEQIRTRTQAFLEMINQGGA